MNRRDLLRGILAVAAIILGWIAWDQRRDQKRNREKTT